MLLDLGWHEMVMCACMFVFEYMERSGYKAILDVHERDCKTSSTMDEQVLNRG